MEQIVNISRDRRRGLFLLNPLGSFKGYGGYVGINPYRELPQDVMAKEIGETIIDLLGKSGATGFHIKNIQAYRRESADPETVRIHSHYLSKIKDSLYKNDVARKMPADVEQNRSCVGSRMSVEQWPKRAE